MERTVGIEPHGIASLIICRSTTTTSLLLCRSQRLCLPWILDHWRIISAIEICNRRPDTLRLRLIDLMGSGRTNVWREPLEAVETERGSLASRFSPIPAETHPQNNLSDRH